MNKLDDVRFEADLMSGDIVVGHIHSRYVDPIKKDFLPLCFTNGGDIENWLDHRAIDDHRTHSRLLKKVLRLKERDNVSTALHFHAATLTDNYWIRPKDSLLTWSDVRFCQNDFAELALSGSLADFSKKPSRTPELTNTGSFEKCWKYEDSAWWMYKTGNENERFSELFTFELCKRLEFTTAEYRLAGPYIKTRDFTNGVLNFEPAAYIVGEDEDYERSYRAFQQYGQNIADDYIEILLMDTMCRNADRHTYNYGLLRSQDTGRVVSLAPNFDNNISLISSGYDSEPRKKDLLIELLEEFEANTSAVTDYLRRHPKPIVTEAMIRECCKSTGIRIDQNYIANFVMFGYRNLPVW